MTLPLYPPLQVTVLPASREGAARPSREILTRTTSPSLFKESAIFPTDVARPSYKGSKCHSANTETRANPGWGGGAIELIHRRDEAFRRDREREREARLFARTIMYSHERIRRERRAFWRR